MNRIGEFVERLNKLLLMSNASVLVKQRNVGCHILNTDTNSLRGVRWIRGVECIRHGGIGWPQIAHGVHYNFVRAKCR